MSITKIIFLFATAVGCQCTGKTGNVSGVSTIPLGEAIGIILAFIGVVLALLSYIRKRENTREFPYFFTNDANALADILFPHKELEKYVVRQQLKDVLGLTLIPENPRILIYGLSAVGKSREGFELVKRLGRMAVYLDTSGNPEVPPSLEKGHPRQKVVLFLDNLRVETYPSTSDEERGVQETTSPRVERVLKFFRGRTDLRNVIITMTTKEFEKLKEDPDSSSLLDQFVVFHLQEFTVPEKGRYIGDITSRQGLSLNSKCSNLLAQSGVSLNDLYDWLERLSQRFDKQITPEDVTDFVQHTQAIWRQQYTDLTTKEKGVFESLKLLYAASIPLFEDIAIELSLRDYAWWGRLLKHQPHQEALHKLARRYLTIESGQVYCPDYRLRVNEPEEATIKRALAALVPIARKLTKRRKRALHAIRLLKPLAKSLAEYGLFKESITTNAIILDLPHERLGESAARIRSDAYFHQGLSYYRLGRETWQQAEYCYNAAIQEDNNNQFPKHALATLLRRRNSIDQSLCLLNEILAADPSDFIACKTRLEILVDERRMAEAVHSYRALRRLLHDTSMNSKMVLSAELACVGFSAALTEDRYEEKHAPKAERAASRTITRYEQLLERIPTDLVEFEAIVRNSYGCFLYDVLSRSDAGLVQLRKAHQVWPDNEYTLHKLSTVYLAEAEVISAERETLIIKARDLMSRLLDANPNHYPGLLLIARIEGISIDWQNINDKIFWEKVAEIYAMYQKALEPEIEICSSLHNSIVHHSAGCFLWHVEASAHKRNFTDSKSEVIPSADKEFRDSIKGFETGGIFSTRAAQRQLILGLYTLGAYLLTVAGGAGETQREGHNYIAKAFDLSSSVSSPFRFSSSSNSFVESFIGKLYLSMGNLAEARRLLESAVVRFPRNWRAWWFLGRVNELDKRVDEALTCFEKSAAGQASSSLYGQIRKILSDNKQNATTKEKLRFSKQAYDLDPEGNTNPKNLSDYGYDLYNEACTSCDTNQFLKAEQILLKAYKRDPQSFSLWLAAEARERLLGYIDEEGMKRYIKATRLSERRDDYRGLKIKVTTKYATRIWKNGKVPDDIVDSIVLTAALHPEYGDSLLMAGILLQRNGDETRALPYLEEARKLKDPYGLRALLECYASLPNTQKVEEIFSELLPLLSEEEGQKLELRISSLGY